MKKTHWIILALALSTAMACNTDKPGTPQPDSEKKITFRTSIESEAVVSEKAARSPQLTEGGSGNFAEGDIFLLQASAPSGQTTTVEYRVGSSELYWKDILRGPEDQSIDFAACYPIQDLQNGKFSFDLETADNRDLLWAHSKKVPLMTDSPVNLTFKHVMHRLVINYEVVSEGLSDNSIQTVCTAKSTCEIDLASGTLDISASRKADFTEIGNKAVFLIVPQQTSDVSLRITLGQNVQEFSLDDLFSEHKNLEGSMQMNVNLKVKNGTVSLSGSSIAGWGNQGTVEGEIIM